MATKLTPCQAILRDYDGREWALTLAPEKASGPLDARGTAYLRDSGTAFINLPIVVLLDAAAEYVRIKRLEALKDASSEDLLRIPYIE